MSIDNLRLGAVGVRLRLFKGPAEELLQALSPPYPDWMVRLYKLEEMSDTRRPGDDGDAVTPTVGAALAALSTRMRNRLDLAAWVVSAMQELGWAPELDGDELVMTKVILPELAHEELERAGVTGPMTRLCELDGRGFPLLHQRSERHQDERP